MKPVRPRYQEILAPLRHLLFLIRHEKTFHGVDLLRRHHGGLLYHGHHYGPVSVAHQHRRPQTFDLNDPLRWFLATVHLPFVFDGDGDGDGVVLHLNFRFPESCSVNGFSAA